MALQLAVESSHGVTGDYWEITRFSFNLLEERDSFSVCMWLNAAANAAAKKSLKELNYHFPDGEVESPFTEEALGENSPCVIAYAWLKTRPEFAGALDV